MSQDEYREIFNTVNRFLQEVEDVDTSELGVDLLVAREVAEQEDETEYNFGRIPLGQSIPEKLEELVREKVGNKIEAVENDSIEFDEYRLANADKEKSFVQYEPIDNLPSPDNFDRLFEGQRFTHTSYIEGEKPEFQAIRIRGPDNDRMAIAFLHYTRRQVLGRTSWLRMKVGDDSHREVEESILSIPDRVDAVYYDGVFFVFDQSKFEKMFDYLDQYEEQADDVVETIRENDIPFEDFELFEDAIYGNNRVLRLMHKVHKRGAYEEMDSDDAEYIRENFDTDVKFKENDDGDLIITMDDKRDVWAVLRFFNDDHLNSPLTDEQYLSLAKEDAG